MATATAAKVIQQIRKLAAVEDRSHQTDRQLLECFVDRQDESAFHALVRRHGPLVLGVCRRVLRHEQDAEDAFQATFLILARKAASIGKKDSLCGWLYKVAYHAAIKARLRATPRTPRLDSEPLSARSDAELCKATHPASRDPLDELTGRELLAVLDEEMQRLPERLRVPLIHCYLQGQTRDQAARQLGWSLSTLQRRLEQGRERLRGRLERRGVALSMGLLVAGVSQSASAGALPSVLISATVKAAMLVVAGEIAAAGAISAPALALTNAVLRSLFTTKVKIATVVLLAAGLIGVGVGAITQQVLAQRQGQHSANWVAGAASSKPRQSVRHLVFQDSAPATRTQARAEKERPDEKQMTVSGRVLGPNGKPVPEALVALLTYQKDQRGMPTEENLQMDVLDQGKTDGEGKIHFKVARVAPPMNDLEILSGQLIASAEGYAVGLEGVDLNAERAEVVIRLKPERPLRGRFIDLQGAGIKGIQVRVAAVMEKREPKRVVAMQPSKPLPLWPEPLVTDAEGRLVIRGFAKGQMLFLGIRDDRFSQQSLEIDGDTDDQPKEFTTTLTPAQRIQGRVIYADTGQPALNAQVRVKGQFPFTAHTDKDGRYRLNVGWDQWTNFIDALPPPGEPYLGRVQRLEKPKGGAILQVDLTLPRGVVVRGKVTEAATGKPVKGAEVYYFALRSNQEELQRKGLTLGGVYSVRSRTDGSFQIVVLSGQGTLLVEGPAPDYVLMEIGQNQLFENKPGGARWYVHALLPLNLKQTDDPQEVAVQLRPGVTVKGTVAGPEGQTVSGVRMFSRLNTSAAMGIKYEVRPVPLPKAGFEFKGCDPEKPYPVIFLDEKNQWGTVVELSGKIADGNPMTVRLARCGSAVARFVNPEGKPVVGHWPEVEMLITPGPRISDQGLLTADAVPLCNSYRQHYQFGKPRTDALGRCTFPALIPGVTYSIEKDGHHFDFTAKSGETLDLGDIRLMR